MFWYKYCKRITNGCWWFHLEIPFNKYINLPFYFQDFCWKWLAKWTCCARLDEINLLATFKLNLEVKTTKMLGNLDAIVLKWDLPKPCRYLGKPHSLFIKYLTVRRNRRWPYATLSGRTTRASLAGSSSSWGSCWRTWRTNWTQFGVIFEKVLF